VTWAAIVAQATEDVVSTFGEPVTYAPTVGAAVACEAVILRRSEPVLRGGQITIDEDHYQGQIAVTALAAEPVIGDTLTSADATVYRVDAPPTRKDGLWLLRLRWMD
jgi:hypothetical protein